MNDVRQARHMLPMVGNTYKLGKMEMAFKVGHTDSGGAYTLCETIVPENSGAGLHRHPTFDETFIITAGTFDYHVDGKDFEVGPGETVFIPRGTPHSFKCKGPEAGRQMIISSPGGIFDVFIDDVVTALAEAGTPSDSASTTNVGAIAAKHGIEWLS